MPVKQVPVKYEASDGQEFDTEEEAQTHDDLIKARAEYDTARQNFNRVLARSQKTADGEEFDFSLFRTYYYVTGHYDRMPWLKSVSFLGWNFEISEHDDIIEISQNEGEMGREHRYPYPINKLWVDKRKANEALINALHSWLDEQRRTINDTIKEIRKAS